MIGTKKLSTIRQEIEKALGGTAVHGRLILVRNAASVNEIPRIGEA